MSHKQIVKDILVAIASVKSRAKAAYNNGDNLEFTRLMGDLLALEVCLVNESEQLMVELEGLEEDEAA